jgi:AraC-like DNA-binding protein
MMNRCSLSTLIARLDAGALDIHFDRMINPYWKRPFEWSSDKQQYRLQELNFVIKGRIHGSVAGKRVHCGAGELFWMGPETEHSLTWPKDLIYYSFRFDLTNGIDHYTIDQPCLQLKNTTGLESFFRRIATIEKLTPSAPYRLVQLRAWFALLLIEMQVRQEWSGGSVARTFTDYQRQAILGLCADHRYTGLDSGKLADRFDLSRDYFSRLFRATFGVSFKSWIFSERMKHAAMLLLDGELDVPDLADYFGYDDIYLFAREFKKVMGLTPRQYRARNLLVLDRVTGSQPPT